MRIPVIQGLAGTFHALADRLLTLIVNNQYVSLPDSLRKPHEDRYVGTLTDTFYFIVGILTVTVVPSPGTPLKVLSPPKIFARS